MFLASGIGRAAALGAALVLTGASSAAAAQNPTLASLVSPAVGETVEQDGALEARLRVEAGVSVTRVTLNGRTTHARVGPRRGGAREIVLRPADGLRGGRNVLSVSTRSASSGDVDFDQSRFWYAKRDPSLLTLGAPPAGTSVDPAPVATVIRTRVPVERMRVWLNGRAVEDVFSDPDDANRLRARLGAVDGLVQGRNVLRVEAVRGNRFERTSRAFRVDGTCPLVSAGADHSVQAGQPVQLQGAALASPVPTDHSPSYSWRLARAPTGSAAELTAARSARPILQTDVPGRYVLRLVARQGGCASLPDTATVNAFPQVTVPVSTVAKNTEGAYGVRVGGRFHANPGGSSPRVQLVVLDRATLELQKNVGIPPGRPGLKRLGAELKDVTPSSTVILSAPPGSVLLTAREFNPITAPFLLVELRLLFSGLGSELPRSFDLAKTGIRGPFSLITVPQTPGPPNGQATQTLAPVGAGAGNLGGNFVLDANSNYAFSFDAFPSFDTRASGSGSAPNAIRVGASSYPAAALADEAGGGFQVVVIDRYTLAEVSNQTFATNSADGAAAMARMASTLKAAADNQGHLVMLTSLGRAAPQRFDATIASAWTALGAQVGRLNGTRDVFLRLRGGDSYSLVGASASLAAAAEASSRITPELASGQLTGIIARDDRGLFGPGVGVPGGTLNFELAQIAYQAPTPWPDAGPGEAAANAYIAKELDLIGTDVRANYTNDVPWATKLTELLRLPYPGGDPGFSQDVFEALRAELALEFGWVEQTLGPGKYVANLKAPFQKTSRAYAQLQKAATDIDQALSPPETSTATATWLAVIGDTLTAVSRIDPELTAVGALGSLFSAGSALATLSDGSPVNSVEASAAELGVEFTESMATQRAAIDALGDVIVSDYGKLKAVGTNASSNPAWAWPATTVDTAETRFVQGATQRFYGSLMPLAYGAWRISWPANYPADARYRLAREETAADFTCEIDSTQKNSQPWKGAPSSAQALLAEGVDEAGEINGRWWAWGLGEPTKTNFRTPPSSLTDPLFESLDTPGGIGLFKPWFFTRSFTPQDFTSCYLLRPPPRG